MATTRRSFDDILFSLAIIISILPAHNALVGIFFKFNSSFGSNTTAAGGGAAICAVAELVGSGEEPSPREFGTPKGSRDYYFHERAGVFVSSRWR
jgi:hypothetical protein